MEQQHIVMMLGEIRLSHVATMCQGKTQKNMGQTLIDPTAVLQTICGKFS